jgi:hypothetical protein
MDINIGTQEETIPTVKLGVAGLGSRRIGIANLPPEMPRTNIIRALEPFEKVGDIRLEMLSQAYHYKVSNGILIVQIELSKHVPSHLTIGGCRALVSYDGQPTTCYACNASGHLTQQCRGRQRTQAPEVTNRKETWATFSSVRRVQ